MFGIKNIIRIYILMILIILAKSKRTYYFLFEVINKEINQRITFNFLDKVIVQLV